MDASNQVASVIGRAGDRFMKLLIGTLLAASFMFATVPLSATTYYVAKSGSDSSNCTSASAPCLTIGRGVSVATAAGSIVQVGAGTYSESITLSNAGTASAPITVRGQDGSGCPTTPNSDVNSPTGTRPNSSVIVLGGFQVNASYVAVDCFHLKTTSGNGGVQSGSGLIGNSYTNIEVDGNGCTSCGGGFYISGVATVVSSGYSSNFTISRNYVHGVSNGYYGACSNCTISDNEIYALQGDEPGSDHDYVDTWGIGTIIRHNYMHGNTSNACNSYDCHMDCVQTWNTTGDSKEVSKNVIIDRNVCFNHHEGVIVQDNASNGDVSNWTVSNNVFAYPPWDDGSGHPSVAGSVQPWCWVFEDGKLGTNSFYNNTCIDGAEGFRNNSGSASFKDNLFYSASNDTSMYDTSGATVTGANNLYFAAGGTFGGVPFGGDIINKNPNFISMGSSTSQCIGCNFNIQSASAAKDVGVSTSPTVVSDLRGTARPQGTAFDIGAYEYAGTTKPGTPLSLGGVAY